MISVTLSYTLCTITPVPFQVQKACSYTLREKKTPEEAKAEREYKKATGDTSKVNPYKFKSGTTLFMDGSVGHFLIGIWPHIEKTLKELGEEYAISDQRDPGVSPPPQYENLQGVEFRTGQLEALATLVSSDSGMICSSVAFGKSFLIRQICKVYPTLNIMIVCDAKAVIAELFRDINSDLPGQVALLDMSHKHIDGKRIVVTTTKSMHKLPPEKVQLVLVDECHCVGDNATGSDLMKFVFARRFGFTATPIRNNGDYLAMEALLGPPIFNQSFSESAEAGAVTPIMWSMVPFTRKLDYLAEVDKLPDAIQMRLLYTNNPARNALIKQVFDDVVAADPDAQVLIMVKTVEHLIRLCELIPDLQFAHGKRDSMEEYRGKKGLEKVWLKKYEQTDKQASWVKRCAENGEYKHLIANGVWSKGINLHHLKVLIRADGAKSGIPSVQIPGRLARLDENKSCAFLIDIDDAFCAKAEDRAKARALWYGKQEWQQVGYIDMLNMLKEKTNEEVGKEVH